MVLLSAGEIKFCSTQYLRIHQSRCKENVISVYLFTIVQCVMVVKYFLKYGHRDLTVQYTGAADGGTTMRACVLCITDSLECTAHISQLDLG